MQDINLDNLDDEQLLTQIDGGGIIGYVLGYIFGGGYGGIVKDSMACGCDPTLSM